MYTFRSSEWACEAHVHFWSNELYIILQDRVICCLCIGLQKCSLPLESTFMLKDSDSSNIIDIYMIQSSESHTSSLFLTDVELRDDKGRVMQEEWMVDDGAMVNTIDLEVYDALKQKIGGWKVTTQQLWMADGFVVQGKAC